MTCVELHVGVKPAMKLESRSKVASLRIYVYRDFDMWRREHGVKLLRQFCRLMRRFLRCGWMALFWRSRTLKFNFTEKFP